MRRVNLLIVLTIVASYCAAQSIDRSKLVDLSYSYNEKTIYWPNAKGFEHRKDNWKTTPAGYWYAAGGFSSDEHGGTHIDSPIHFGQGKTTLDQLSVQKLVGPAVVIDITAASTKNRDYRATAQASLYGKNPTGKSQGARLCFSGPVGESFGQTASNI